MLSWFRVWARSISGVALASLLALTVSSAVPHADEGHDADCGIVAVHDPSGHSIGREQSAPEHPLHCVLCHSTRSVRPSTETPHANAPAVEEDVRVHLDDFRAAQHFASAQPPLRGPPPHS